ncbi:MAG TPA: hypothetical protein VHZ50_12650 [Puia sp.]|jgi:hypothetical protein|nr:hypothetical protein [Puia sp.]
MNNNTKHIKNRLKSISQKSTTNRFESLRLIYPSLWRPYPLFPHLYAKDARDTFFQTLMEILKTLSNKGVFLDETDIKKIHQLNVYRQREIVRDWLVFLYYHSFDKCNFKTVTHNRLSIKPKLASKMERKILEKYDYKIPIVDVKTIANYLPDVLMMAGISFKPMYNKEVLTRPLSFAINHSISSIDIKECNIRLGNHNTGTLLKYSNRFTE